MSNNSQSINNYTKGFQTPESRWARYGPYYAMFPLDFAFEVVERYSNPGDYIIDPFAGRCSSVYAGGVLGRHSLGIEINPVGWLYGTVKLSPASESSVLNRLSEIYSKRNYYKKSIDSLPEFHRICFCDEVLQFLLAARKHLDWENDNIDATLMSMLLVYLHGRIGEGLSNQMKKAKSMGPQYSVNWWKRNGFRRPPEINPLDFLSKRISWRYAKGVPKIYDSRVLRGDSVFELENIVDGSKKTDIKFSLLFTSPPYCSVTDYHADQWLRLWLLGGSSLPSYSQEKHKGRFVSQDQYYELLNSVFANCAQIMENESTVYVRTDKREFTFNTTLEILKYNFPEHRARVIEKPLLNKTQTGAFGNFSNSSGEIDILMRRN